MAGDEQILNEAAELLRGHTKAAKLSAFVLRTRSSQAAHLLTHCATDGRASEQLRELARPWAAAVASPSPAAMELAGSLDPSWLSQVARVAALSEGPNGDVDLAVALFELIGSTRGLQSLDRDSATLYAQLVVRFGAADAVDDLLQTLDVSDLDRWAIELDSINPFTRPGRPVSRWLERLNSQFRSNGLEPVGLGQNPQAPFDRLTAQPSSFIREGELVTVIMPAYRPDGSIHTAVNSVLSQSWENLELLIVDDASPPSFHDLLHEVEQLDDRVRLLAMPSNRGTYAARNFALNQAGGTYVTFQDSDDWSHPRRIELQLLPLLDDPELLATRSRMIRAFPDLTFTFCGYPPIRTNPWSLLFRRRDVASLIGGFDPVRKSADMEFPERLEAAAPGSLLDLAKPAPLAIYQLREHSLSRGDAAPGWLRWDRLAYRDAYRHWHAKVQRGTVKADNPGTCSPRRMPMPQSSWASSSHERTDPRHYDVLVLNDWRSGRGSHRALIDEITLLTDVNPAVAVAHLETPFPLAEHRQRLSSSIQALINSGQVDLVHVSQAVQAELVVVGDPAVLQFIPDAACAVQAGLVAILCDVRGHAQRYRVADCNSNLARLFPSQRSTWVPRDSDTRAWLAAQLSKVSISESDLPPGFSPALFAANVRRPHPTRPVLGRHAGDDLNSWPADRTELLSAYPADEPFDVRIMGGDRIPRMVLGREAMPTNWTSFDRDEITVRAFLAQLDFFVFFPNPTAEIGSARSILEALASGCVAILPVSFESEYGDGAKYCTPEEVEGVVMSAYRSPASYSDQQRRGRRRAAASDSSDAYLAGMDFLARSSSA